MEKQVSFRNIRIRGYLRTFYFFIIFLSFFIGIFCFYLSKYCITSNQTILESIYHFTNEDSSFVAQFISDYFSKAIIYTACFIIIVFVPKMFVKKDLIRFLLDVFYFILSFIILFRGITININMGILGNNIVESNIQNIQFVDEKDLTFSFPESKRNLIIIYTNNISTSYRDVVYEENSINLIPELSVLLNENSLMMTNNGYTILPNYSSSIEGIVAQTSGVPVYKNDNEKLVPSSNTLGKILTENGYVNEFLYGSSSDSEEIKAYLCQNLNYKFFDLSYIRDNQLIDYSSSEWWGLQDHTLFEFAKSEIESLLSSNSPFSLSLLTSDLQNMEGYCPYCEAVYSDSYLNKINCSSKQIFNFVNWCKEQGWYENTTIIISSDCVTNDINAQTTTNKNGLFIVLNSPTQSSSQEERTYSIYDIFPTTLSSLGVDWEGDTIGFGKDLFKNNKTLCECMDLEVLQQKLKDFSQNNKYIYYKKEEIEEESLIEEELPNEEEEIYYNEYSEPELNNNPVMNNYSNNYFKPSNVEEPTVSPENPNTEIETPTPSLPNKPNGGSLPPGMVPIE